MGKGLYFEAVYLKSWKLILLDRVLMESEEQDKLRAANPEFAKLVDIINGTYLEEGMPKSVWSEQKKVYNNVFSLTLVPS